MNYKGYRIEHDKDHYVVTGPEGETWTEDTVKEAKEAIDFFRGKRGTDMTREEQINTLTAIIQECEEYQWQRKETLYEIIKALEQEPKAGYWIEKENWLGVGKRVQCSECGQVFVTGDKRNYCANCGCKNV